MQKILVPTDFSDTSVNAAFYAIKLAKQIGIKKIIFYHAYQMPVSVTDPMLPNLQLFTIEDQKKLSETEMENFVRQISQGIPPSIEYDTLCRFDLLSEGINDLVKEIDADIIVMGITGGSKLDEVLIGSNTISIAKNAHIPVIVIPPGCTFVPINEIVLACDFDKVVDTTPVKPITDLLDSTHAKLMVLNISEHTHIDTVQPFESLMIDTLLYGYHPSYHFIQSTNFLNSMNQFVEDNKVDIIITIPKKHGWFESIFKKSHTNVLAYHSHVPLMVVHE